MLDIKFARYLLFGLGAALFPGPLISQPENRSQAPNGLACASDATSVQRQIDQLSREYNDLFEQRRSRVEAEAEEIRRRAPRPNEVEGKFDVQLDIEWRDQRFSLDVPEFSMEEQRILFNMPRIELRQQTWIYHTPSIRMEMRCVNGPPELVCWSDRECMFGSICVDIPRCAIRGGQQICTDVPTLFMQEQRTVLGVPEITGTDEHNMIISLPQIAMRRQDWILRLPEFRLREVRARAETVKRMMQQLQEREGRESAELAEGMQRNIRSLTIDQISAQFACQEQNVRAQFAAAEREIDANFLYAASQSLAAAQSVSAADMERAMRATIEELTRGKVALVAQRDRALAELAQSRDRAIQMASDRR